MRRFLTVATCLFGSVAVASGLWAAGSGALWPEGRIEFRPETLRVATPLNLLEEHDVTVNIHNGRRRSVRLIGGANLCDPSGCATINGLPLTLPPGSERSLVVHYKPSTPGPFTYEGPIYTDCPEQPTIPLKLAGTIVEKAGK